MLALNDPLWPKLDDAYRDRDIPGLLSELAETWDDDADLLWGRLCHQGTCYGATWAAIPHLLKIAEPKGNRRQRYDIAAFLGHVALRAFDQEQLLSSLPRTIEEWDRKLDGSRKLVATLEHLDRPLTKYERTELLPACKRVLALEPVSAGDLHKIEAIRAKFFASIPAIRALCERALIENLQDTGAVPFLLSGIAAADGLYNLAELLSYGAEGRFRCSVCDAWYDYVLFGGRVAIYADESALPAESRPDKLLSDYRENSTARADGFIVPAPDNEVFDPPTAALLSLAERAPDAVPALLLRSFLGSFHCCKCGVLGPVKAV